MDVQVCWRIFLCEILSLKASSPCWLKIRCPFFTYFCLCLTAVSQECREISVQSVWMAIRISPVRVVQIVPVMVEVVWVKCVISHPVSALVRWVAFWVGFKTDFLCRLITLPLNYHCCLIFHQNNSAGLLCNECKSGFFYLTSSNPQGCTNCVCMGISSNCSSRMDYRTQVVVIINFVSFLFLESYW